MSVTSNPQARSGAGTGRMPRGTAGPMRVQIGGRPRRMPHLMLGVVLVAVSAVGFFAFSLHAAGRVPVLAVAHDVAAGQVLTAADVRVVTVSAGGDVGLVPAGDMDRVVGRPVAVPRPAGALLSPQDVGAARFPPAGKALAAVSLKPGQYPPGLAIGATVTVLVAPTGTATAAGGGGGQVQTFGGLVESVTPQPAAAGGTVVVTLLMDPDPAKAVASAAAGTVSLVQLAPKPGTP